MLRRFLLTMLPGAAFAQGDINRLVVTNPPGAASDAVARILADAASRLQDVGRGMSDRPTWLGRVLNFFEEFRTETEKSGIKHELAGAVNDEQSIALLRRLQQKTSPPANSQGVGPAFN